MSKPIIEIENLGKCYKIGHQKEGYLSLRDEIANSAKGLVSRLKSGSSQTQEDFWALKNVSFSINEGEAVGIIGRNGAGKSTLLKILSQITPPTEGKITLRGRIASLLEVGTGFHPELTGRENIFLNGAILGMTRREIRMKFDEIIAFAEVERFLDTPVKRYSSGMYVRLAFAVAAHLEPEILLVDEVLAVGDAEFQKKCLGKMGEVANSGRTVLFVSHNLGSVRSLCSRAIWLSRGGVVKSGNAADITSDYLASCSQDILCIPDAIRKLPLDPIISFDTINITQNGNETTFIENGQPLDVSIHFTVKEETIGLRLAIFLFDDEHNVLILTYNDEQESVIPTLSVGKYNASARIPANILAPRNYKLCIRAAVHNERWCLGDGINIGLSVCRSNAIGRAFNPKIIPLLQPIVDWVTSKENTNDTIKCC